MADNAIDNDYQSRYLLVTDPSVHCGSAEKVYVEGDEHAFAGGKALPWDTDILHVPCGRVDRLWAAQADKLPKLSACFSRLLHQMDTDGIAFSSVRIGLHAYDLIHLAEKRGFFLTDVMNIYLSRAPYAPGSFDASPFELIVGAAPNEKEIEQAADIASTSFSFSRLYQDKNIPSTVADHFYRSLVISLLKNPASCIGLAYHTDGDVAGFFVGQWEQRRDTTIGYLSLIAVAQQHHGKGLGNSLLRTFLSVMHETCPLVEIGTQVNNTANGLYRLFRLPVVATVATFHRWNG